MAKMKTITCACGCGRRKQVRVADIKRGWGRYFDKSCKARHQEKRTHQYADRCRVRSKDISDDLFYIDYLHPFEDANF